MSFTTTIWSLEAGEMKNTHEIFRDLEMDLKEVKTHVKKED
jgi:hypothetical protein